MAPAPLFRQAELSSLPVMPRPRYRQDPLPLGDCAPPPTLYGPEQPLPAGLERGSLRVGEGTGIAWVEPPKLVLGMDYGIQHPRIWL